MVLNLDRILIKYHIKKGELAEAISISPSKLSDRIRGNTKIRPDQEIKILDFLRRSNVPEDELVNIFEYSDAENDVSRSSVRGLRLKDIISSKGITQTKLANDLGVNKNTVTNWLKGGSISEGKLLSLCEYLDVSSAELILLNHNGHDKGSKYISDQYNSFLLKQIDCINEIRRIVMSYQRHRGYKHRELDLNDEEKAKLDEIITNFLKDDIENFFIEIRPIQKSTEHLIIKDVMKKHINEIHDNLEKVKYWDSIANNPNTPPSEKEHAIDELKLLLNEAREQAEYHVAEDLEVSNIKTINDKRILKRLEELANSKKGD